MTKIKIHYLFQRIISYLDKDNDITQIDIENKAYEILLEYMESKENMQVRNIE